MRFHEEDGLGVVSASLAGTATLCEIQATRRLNTGKGCVVYEGRDPSGQLVAIKLVPKTKESERTIPNEGMLMSSAPQRHHCFCLDHKNIVKLRAFDQTPSHFILIQELCDLGDLHEVMFGDALLTEDTAISWTGQILDALAYLHDEGVAHRDIKLENVAACSGGTIRLLDFEYAAYICRINSRICGTERYLSPELLNAVSLCDLKKADIWAVGILLASLLAAHVSVQHPVGESSSTGALDAQPTHWSFPWQRASLESDDAFMVYCSTGDMAPKYVLAKRIWSKLSPHSKSLLTMMLTVHPGKRISAPDALHFIRTHWPHIPF